MSSRHADSLTSDLPTERIFIFSGSLPRESSLKRPGISFILERFPLAPKRTRVQSSIFVIDNLRLYKSYLDFFTA